MATYPDVNGTAYDWSSIRISLFGEITPAIKGIDYSVSLDPGEARGNSERWLRRTRGQLKAEASFEMYKTEVQDFIDKFGDGFMEKSFDITVAYEEPSQKTIVDTIVGARIKKLADSPKEGSDTPTVKVDLHILEIRYNGVRATRGRIRTF